jgi:hypothetical protein
MNYNVEIGSDAMIYSPGFIIIGSDIQNLLGKTHRHTDRKMIS